MADLKIPKVDIPAVEVINTEEPKKEVLSFTGKLVSAENPVVIGKNNFRELTNMRYAEKSVKSVGGMTKINSTPDATYFKPRNAFQFRKPTITTMESHILAQMYNTGLTASQVWDLTTVPPGTGDFTALWTDSSGSGRGMFSNAPNSTMAYANGVDTCIWEGNESRCGRFMNFDPSGSFSYDFTDTINNTKSDTENCVTFTSSGGGVDANTKMLLHLDNNVTDTVGTHTVTNNLVTLNATGVFSYAGLFNGATSYLSVPDHADFNFSGGAWCFDARVKLNSIAAEQALFSQFTDANNYMVVFVDKSGYLNLEVYETGAAIVDIQVTGKALTTGTWYHIEIGESGNSWYFFVDGKLIAVESASSRAANYTGVFYIGTDSSRYLDGYMDEIRLSNIMRHTADFAIPVVAYSSTAGVNVYVASPRPIQGWTPYIKVANASAATAVGYEWTSSGWASLSITDGSASGGKSLAQTGKISFSSTVTTSKPKFIEGIPLYYYWFTFSGIDAATSIYYVTVDAPFQQIVDLWDGIGRTVGAFYKYNSKYYDYTANVYKNEYNESYTSTYADLNGLPGYSSGSSGNYYILLGFFEFPTAVNIGVAPDKYNTTANTVISGDYWNGAGFATLGTIEDGTSTSGISLAKSGTISWTPPSKSLLFKTTFSNNSVPLYYIRLRWNQALSDTRIYYANGVPMQRTLTGYKFALNSQSRLMLCNNVDGYKNMVTVGASDTCQVFNGDDSFDIFFGDAEEITCGCNVFAMYGSSLYNITLFLKPQSLWGLIQTDSGWKRYEIAPIGCSSPQTLVTVNVPPQEGQQGSNRSIALWLNSTGVYSSDGRHPTPVHDDIKNLFDQNAPTHINLDYIDKFSAFDDKPNHEAHFLVTLTTGAVTALDAEYVLDYKKWRWFKIDRGTGLKLQCGLPVADELGNIYTYGFINTGYCERLEYGNTFDGTDITSTVHFGDFMLGNDLFTDAFINSVTTVMDAKTSATEEVSMTHYINTASTGTAYTVDPTSTGYNITMTPEIMNQTPGMSHSIKYEFTTGSETVGFEPLIACIRYTPVREHDYA